MNWSGWLNKYQQTHQIKFITLKIQLTQTTISVSIIHQQTNQEEIIELIPQIKEYPINIEFNKNEIIVCQQNEINENTFTNILLDLFDHPEKYIPGKNGESLQELRKRAEDFICSLKDMYGETDKKIMIVGHGAMNKALMMVVKDSHDYSQFWSGGLQRNCNVIIIEYKNEMFRIIDEGRIYYER